MKRSLLSLFMAAAGLLCAGTVSAGESVSLDFVSSLLWSGMSDVEFSGNYAYCAMNDGLMVVDVSDPANPTEVSKLSMVRSGFRAPDGVTLAGDYLFLSMAKYGYSVIDISNPAAPVELRHFDSPVNDLGRVYTILDIAASGNLAYITCSDASLTIYDITDPVNPVELDRLVNLNFGYSDFAGDITLAGSCAYLVGSDMIILDVSNPANAVKAGLYDVNSLIAIDVYGNLGFLSASSYGVHILDLTDPVNPVKIAGYDSDPYDARGVVLSGSKAFVNFGGGYDIIDVSDISNPVLISKSWFDNTHFTTSMDLIGNVLYRIDNWYGLEVFDVSDPVNHVEIGNLPTPHSISQFALSGHYAYVDAGRNKIYILDLSDPAAPALIGETTCFDYINDIQVKNNLLIAAVNRSLQIFDISVPDQPAELGRVDVGNGIKMTAVDGDLIYLATSDALYIADISDPSAPAVIPDWSYATSEPCLSVVVNGSMMYAGFGNSGMHIFDISDPANPQYQSVYMIPDYPGPIAVDVVNNLAYMDHYRSSLTVLDMSDPALPQVMADVGGDGGFAITATDDKYAIYSYYSGIGVYDCINPQTPALAAFYDFHSDVCGHDMVLYGDWLYLAADNSFMVFSLGFTTPACGDVQRSGNVDVGDVVFMINTIFKDGPPPASLSGADTNGDGEFNVGDPIYLINFIFKSGPDPICP